MSNKLKQNFKREKNNLANCLVNHPESPLDATLYIIYYDWFRFQFFLLLGMLVYYLVCWKRFHNWTLLFAPELCIKVCGEVSEPVPSVYPDKYCTIFSPLHIILFHQPICLVSAAEKLTTSAVNRQEETFKGTRIGQFETLFSKSI